LEETEGTEAVRQAVGNDKSYTILNLLNEESYSRGDLSEELDLAYITVDRKIDTLEEAELVDSGLERNLNKPGKPATYYWCNEKGEAVLDFFDFLDEV
jgi:DNA-binding transcriptional ArsR family regulator